MISFFRKLRSSLIKNSKHQKYLIYAVGEILLVVIGILIALQINNWNENRKNNELAKFYMESLRTDLQNDVIAIDYITTIQKKDLTFFKNLEKRINSPLATLDTIVNIAKNEYRHSFKAKRDYNNNTFNTIVSSGNLELLDKDLIDALMKLNSIQEDQLKRFSSNLEGYKAININYNKRYNYNSRFKNSYVDNVLWANVDEVELVGLINAAISLRIFTFTNSVGGHLRAKEQSELILKILEELINE